MTRWRADAVKMSGTNAESVALKAKVELQHRVRQTALTSAHTHTHHRLIYYTLSQILLLVGS